MIKNLIDIGAIVDGKSPYFLYARLDLLENSKLPTYYETINYGDFNKVIAGEDIDINIHLKHDRKKLLISGKLGYKIHMELNMSVIEDIHNIINEDLFHNRGGFGK